MYMKWTHLNESRLGASFLKIPRLDESSAEREFLLVNVISLFYDSCLQHLFQKSDSCPPPPRGTLLLNSVQPGK